jgi:2-polyprenyl-3-methyl-5-hydroxy-6-metoxy-1,4-benzoquinol methylase
MKSISWKWKLAQKVELLWWNAYLEKKSVREYKEWKQNYWRNLFLKLEFFDLEKNADILDCGCGPAGVFIALAENFKIDAIDPLLLSYERNLLHFNRSDYPNANFYSESLEDFQHSKLYDVIFCMNAINHVNDIKKCYDKLNAMLKPNGHLVISIDAHNYTFYKFVFKKIPSDILHPHQYSLIDYKELLEKRDFKIVKTELIKSGYFFNHYLQVAKKVNNKP